MGFQIDRDYVIQTLGDLIRINSVNPSLAPGGAGEAEIAAYVGASLDKNGLEVESHEPQPGRVSVVGRLKGRGGGRSLMLNAHLDTVGVREMPEPFSATIREEKMYGRGAYDMKGSLAASMAAARALADAGIALRGDLLVAAVADEEYASLGTVDLIKRYKFDGAVVTEPTEMEICLAHKGFIWLEVETLGRAAHGSRFDEGIDSNMLMGRFLGELEILEQELRSREGHSLLGPPSLHAARMTGGTELSVYAARTRLQIERRTIPGETEPQVMSEFERILAKLKADDPSFRGSLRSLFARQPFEVSPSLTVVKALREAASMVLGRTPAYVGQSPWMDSALLSAAGIETVVMGPKGAGAHADEEWVELKSVVDLAHILAQTALNYCT